MIIHSLKGQPYQPNKLREPVILSSMQKLRTPNLEIADPLPYNLRHAKGPSWIARGMAHYMGTGLLKHSDLKVLTKIYDHTITKTS